MTKESNENIINKVRGILENFHLIADKIKWIQANKDNILTLGLNNQIRELDFYKLTSLLSTQSRSSLGEKYFKKKYNYEPVKKNENRGDLKKDNQYYEYKVSLNDQFNFRLIQIRIWQECDYIFQFITFEEIFTFHLTKEQMKKCNDNIAHGTKEANKNNEKIEYTMTIKKESADWQRWIKKIFKKSLGKKYEYQN